MLFNSTDGEIRAYKKTKDGNCYLEILFYNSDFCAPMYINGDLSFSCSIGDNSYTDTLINFFNINSRSIWIESIWESPNKKLGKRYHIELEKENILLRENLKHLDFVIKAKVIDNEFIDNFSEGKKI